MPDRADADIPRVDSLVGADTGGFKSLGTQLLILVGNEMNAERELIDVCALAAKIENANLSVGHTSVEARLAIWSQSVFLASWSRFVVHTGKACSCEVISVSSRHVLAVGRFTCSTCLTC